MALQTQASVLMGNSMIKGGFGDDFRVQVKILKPKYLSIPWSKLKNISDHQVKKFLNNYMIITDELVFTQIYLILHSISIQKWKKKVKLKVEMYRVSQKHVYPRNPHSDEGLIPRANIFYIGSDP